MTALFVAFVLLAAPLVLGLARANELFLLRVKRSQFKLARGAAPLALLRDFEDVLQGTEHAVVRAVVEGGRPTLEVRGPVAHEVRQRLRNVLGRFTVSQIRAAARSARAKIG